MVVAMMFLSPGRHAGTGGDVARICRGTNVRCHLTAPVGDHPAVVDVLAGALRDELAARSRATAAVPVEAGENVN